ncbi:hypothetical protein CPC08DRAFT_645893, partial [Agrocybe pediades]
VYPKSTEDVVQIVKIATKYRAPITAYSGATSSDGTHREVRLDATNLACAWYLCDWIVTI